MKFGSLFAGVGGFDLGLEAAGWECAWQVEWDPHCQQTLAHHWPNVPRWGDVSDVNGAHLPPVDVVTFGSPCQDLSVAGKRAGLEGSRSNLFFQATRIIREMQHATGGTFPRYAIWENVVGALNSNGGDDFEAVLEEMADLGSHHLEWAVLDAQFFGVPQRRRRVFVIACLDSSKAGRGGGQILAVGEGRRRNPSTRKQTRQDAAGTVTDSFGTGSEGFRLRAFGDYVDDDCASTIQRRDYKYPTDLVVPAPIVFSHMQGLDAQPSDVHPPTLRSNGAGMAVAYTPSSHAAYTEGVGTIRANGGDLGGGGKRNIVGSLQAQDYKGVGTQYVTEGKLVIQ